MATRRVRLIADTSQRGQQIETQLRARLQALLPGVPIIRCCGSYSDDWCLSAELTEAQEDEWRKACTNYVVFGFIEDDL